MRVGRGLAVGVAMGLVLSGSSAMGQGKPTCDASGKVKTPEKIEGQVIKVDPGRGILTLREADGTVHEFQASKEMLQDTKVGDHLEGKLREAPKCP